MAQVRGLGVGDLGVGRACLWGVWAKYIGLVPLAVCPPTIGVQPWPANH